MDQLASAVPNSNQSEDWNGATGRRWLDWHEAVDRQIAPFGFRAMERADIQPGQHVLDVGCGCGETTVELARRVGASGSVTGVDISQLLIDTARQASNRSNFSNVRFEVADAQTFAFPPHSVDFVFSRFGVMFFDDPEAAFANFRKALRCGGRLSFVCWPAPQDHKFMTIPMAAARRHITLPQPGDPEAPGPFAFADSGRVKRILSGAGFSEIQIDRVIEKVGGGTLDETARMLMELGPLSRVLDDVDATIRHAIFEDTRSSLEGFESSGRVLIDAAAWLVTARSA
jgi:ubiquinone/menaquinone biosynthesis C-methylase UbiE